jgi:hypothetical protein
MAQGLGPQESRFYKAGSRTAGGQAPIWRSKAWPVNPARESDLSLPSTARSDGVLPCGVADNSVRSWRDHMLIHLEAAAQHP